MSNWVTILERVGGTFHTPELMEMETEALYPGSKYNAISLDEQQKVRAVVKEKYLATLFLGRSDKRHYQLKDDIKNTYSKGNKDAFPSTTSATMQLMQEYCKQQPDKAVVPAQGTAFAGAGGKGGKKKEGRLANDEWWALSPEERAKIDAKRKAAKEAAAKSADDGKPKSKVKDKKDGNNDDKSVASPQKKLQRSESNLKKVTKCLVTLSEGDKSDLSDEDGSNNMLAECTLQDHSPMLGAWYAQAKKFGKLRGAVRCFPTQERL